MNPGRRKAIGALVAMTGAAALAKVGRPTERIADERKTDLDAMFPAAFGRWRLDSSMPVVLPAPDIQAKLDAIYNQVLSRTYVDDAAERVMLSVAYGGDQSDGLSVHLPEVCYPAQGFQVRSRRRDRIELSDRTLSVIRLSTRLGQRFEPVTYWITVGDQVVPTRTEQKLAQIGYGLRGQIPDGMLIRLSTIDRDPAHAFNVHDGFVRDLAARLSDKPGAERILGRIE